MVTAKVAKANVEQCSLVKYITVYVRMEYHTAIKKKNAELLMLIGIAQ